MNTVLQTNPEPAGCCQTKKKMASCCANSGPEMTHGNAASAFWNDLKVWKVASRNTLNCLIGCSIGDFAVVVLMQKFYPHASMALTMPLAMAAGLLTSIVFETTLLHLKEKFSWSEALKTAFSMSFLSMVGMELAENITDLALTGGKVPLHHPFYWTALGISLVAGFLAPLPYNYWKFKKHGKSCH